MSTELKRYLAMGYRGITETDARWLGRFEEILKQERKLKKLAK